MTSDAKLASIPPLPLQHIFSFLSRSDLLKTSLVSKDWHTVSSKKLWSTFKFVREREFERIFHILSKSNITTRYGNFITSLELVHSDKDFCISSNHIFLITMLCPNLSSLSITFHHTRPVAPPHMLANNNLNNNNLNNNPRRLPPPQLMLARQQQQQQQQNPQQQKLQQPLPQQQQPINVLPQQNPFPQPQLNALPAAPLPPRHTQNLPLAHFAHNCLKLKSIRLVSYSPKTDDSVYEMAKYLKSGSLESIAFINCSTIQSSTLCKLAMTNPQLKSVEIMGNTPISDSSLATIADRCGQSLEYLSIGNACQLTDKSIRYIPARCKKLLQLCIFNNNIEKISQDTLTSIIHHCTHLQMMSISDSRTLGSVFFDVVVQRVNNEIEKINRNQANCRSGLQTLCLGGVKREIVTSKYVKFLVDCSASKHDFDQNENEQEDLDMSDQLTHLNKTSKFTPKSTVIRGNTIWWQRRRISKRA